MSNRSMSHHFYHEFNKGMTMVELLVVIAILGILMVALFGVIQPLQQIERGRDGRRLSDIKAMQSAFEQYYTLNGYKYDTTIVAGRACSNMAGTLSGGRLPDAPSGSNYTCEGRTAPLNDPNAIDYCVCGLLQNQQMQIKFGNSQNEHCNFQLQGTAADGTPSNKFYCLVNQQ